MKNKNKFLKLYLMMLSLVLSVTAFALKDSSVAQAATTLSSSQIANSSDRDYVNKAIAYYLGLSDSQTALSNNQAVIMLFEGASDNAQTIEGYRNSSAGTSYYNTRTSAICVVIKKDATGTPSIVYFNEDCSSLPCYPSQGVATTKDGVYRIIAHNHKSRYAALQVQAKTGSTYSSSSVPAVRLTSTSYTDSTASGINIHTRGTKTVGGWSEGCILIDYYRSNYRIPLYRDFLAAAYPSSVTFDNLDGQLGSSTSSYKSVKLPYITGGHHNVVGTFILDRYLYQEEMEVIYDNADAVASIVKHSVDSAAKMGSTKPITIQVSLATNPIPQGSSCNILGTVTSTSKLKTVTGTITTSTGSYVQEKTISPTGSSVSLSSSLINSQLRFGTLAAGYYKLTISATNIAGASASQTISFQVKGASTLAINPSLDTTKITQGKSCNINGTVTSNYSITNVTASIYTSGGTLKQTESITPNSTSVSLRSTTINSKLKFGTLSAGSYKIVFTATDASKKSVSEELTFSVVSASTLKVDVNMASTSITQGKGCNITGTVSSNQVITEVTGYIYNSANQPVQSKTIYPNSTSVDIKTSAINSSLKFGQLAKGSYTLKVVAKDASGTKEDSVSFTIK